MQPIGFALRAAAGRTQYEAILLIQSLRDFGGTLADSPVWVLVPEVAPLDDIAASRLRDLNVEIVPFGMTAELIGFPFATKVMASAEAESIAKDSVSTLVWSDSDNLIFQDPQALLLNSAHDFAYRPVDHMLIGSRYSEPVDGFWRIIYEHFSIDSDSLWSMTTTADEQEIRPYFNAGLLVVRPARNLLTTWRDSFLELYRDKRLLPFYQQNQLYAIFVHQAILAGAVLSSLGPDSMKQLPHTVHYPLHMHKDVPPARKTARMNDLVTARHDTFFNDPDWREIIPTADPLTNWLETHVPLLRTNNE